MKKMHKSRRDKKICGVCGGVAEYFEIDVNIVRVAWTILALFFGAGLLAYLACAIILPFEG